MTEPIEHAIETVPVMKAYRIDQISSAGITGYIDATKAQRDEIAALLDLPGLEEFKFDYQLRTTKKGRLKLKGKLFARLTQSCVVTLEPVPAHIDETIEIDFWPAEDVKLLEKESDPESMSLQLDGPEPLSSDTIDVGLLAYEHFVASLELYPKQTNARLDQKYRVDGEENNLRDNPFSVLTKLNVKQETD